MSSGSAMFSDDDQPLAAKSMPNGKANTSRTNGYVKEEGDFDMSEDDDQPLVRCNHSESDLLGADLAFADVAGRTEARKDVPSSKAEASHCFRLTLQ